MIKTKRVYDPQEPEDGARFLIDRLWPRGIKKDALNFNAWLKDIAPSNQLRIWFGHKPEKWDEFRKRYFTELDSRTEAVRLLIESASHNNVTLLYSAKDKSHNNAIVLKEYLEKQVCVCR
ncbi:MAG: DUF488 domain-containing protein [Nitrospirae bacterium]|nr:DUF488 domain-containing protein [Nitrospirota bacterium]